LLDHVRATCDLVSRKRWGTTDKLLLRYTNSSILFHLFIVSQPLEAPNGKEQIQELSHCDGRYHKSNIQGHALDTSPTMTECVTNYCLCLHIVKLK
jgi:hypothetical protein